MKKKSLSGLTASFKLNLIVVASPSNKLTSSILCVLSNPKTKEN